jgi:hypothetical protein
MQKNLKNVFDNIYMVKNEHMTKRKSPPEKAIDRELEFTMREVECLVKDPNLQPIMVEYLKANALPRLQKLIEDKRRRITRELGE